jgi:hypothetical protein
LNSKKGVVAPPLLIGCLFRFSRILQFIRSIYQRLRGWSKLQTSTKQDELEGKVFAGVKWQEQRKNDFGNVFISETELTFFKNLTEYTKRISLRVSIDSIRTISLDHTASDLMIIHLHYVHSDGETKTVKFYSIMDTHAIGNEIFNRIQHYRIKAN